MSSEGDPHARWSLSDVHWDGLTLQARAAGPDSAPPVPELKKYYIKGRAGAAPSSPSVASTLCRVPGCGADLTKDLAYFRSCRGRGGGVGKYRICREHLKSPLLMVEGVPSRFCQQCSRFHNVAEFDGPQRTCRTMLERLRIKRNSGKPVGSGRRGKDSMREAEAAAQPGSSGSHSNSSGKGTEEAGSHPAPASRRGLLPSSSEGADSGPKQRTVGDGASLHAASQPLSAVQQLSLGASCSAAALLPLSRLGGPLEFALPQGGARLPPPCGHPAAAAPVGGGGGGLPECNSDFPSLVGGLRTVDAARTGVAAAAANFILHVGGPGGGGAAGSAGGGGGVRSPLFLDAPYGQSYVRQQQPYGQQFGAPGAALLAGQGVGPQAGLQPERLLQQREPRDGPGAQGRGALSGLQRASTPSAGDLVGGLLQEPGGAGGGGPQSRYPAPVGRVAGDMGLEEQLRDMYRESDFLRLHNQQQVQGSVKRKLEPSSSAPTPGPHGTPQGPAPAQPLSSAAYMTDLLGLLPFSGQDMEAMEMDTSAHAMAAAGARPAGHGQARDPQAGLASAALGGQSQSMAAMLDEAGGGHGMQLNLPTLASSSGYHPTASGGGTASGGAVHDGSRGGGGRPASSDTCFSDARASADGGSQMAAAYGSMYGGNMYGGGSSRALAGMAAIPEAGDGRVGGWASPDDVDAALDLLMDEAGFGAVYDTRCDAEKSLLYYRGAAATAAASTATPSPVTSATAYRSWGSDAPISDHGTGPVPPAGDNSTDMALECPSPAAVGAGAGAGAAADSATAPAAAATVAAYSGAGIARRSENTVDSAEDYRERALLRRDAASLADVVAALELLEVGVITRGTSTGAGAGARAVAGAEGGGPAGMPAAGVPAWAVEQAAGAAAAAPRAGAVAEDAAALATAGGGSVGSAVAAVMPFMGDSTDDWLATRRRLRAVAAEAAGAVAEAAEAMAAAHPKEVLVGEGGGPVDWRRADGKKGDGDGGYGGCGGQGGEGQQGFAADRGEAAFDDFRSAAGSSCSGVAVEVAAAGPKGGGSPRSSVAVGVLAAAAVGLLCGGGVLPAIVLLAVVALVEAAAKAGVFGAAGARA
ncbi:Squamosa promoter-binding-like protein 5 [Tetrabaena socialis]|uniref:Squamosa promoter-binding-like protein 5 n=1 Tax=Tetrabaena socialis TaxID=47790 RepID=A0A2J8AIX0_9CHLO|nr:Squamosa promoter-binding-like protein 5 [Tetrabaena socialis]|eukprot:PNH12458.1 Squamosa promoter-binding-like protein 5 [Tetrabaena socialis]